MKFFVSSPATGTLSGRADAATTTVFACVALAVACSPSLRAQQVLLAATAEPASPSSLSLNMAAERTVFSSSAETATPEVLPDAPAPVVPVTKDDHTLVASLPAAAYGEAPGATVAPKYAKFIASTETAQKINAHDKVVIGLRDLYSIENGLAIVFSAGYEQVTNGEPNYGTNSTAFGKRVGAAAIRETSQGLFTDVVFSPLFRDDPRYFAEGDGVGFLHRTVYAVTRVLVTRSDTGHSTVNAPLLLGYAATAAMTPLYYPQINRNFKDTASNYGGSLGGAAVGFLFSEFSDSLLETLHFKKKP